MPGFSRALRVAGAAGALMVAVAVTNATPVAAQSVAARASSLQFLGFEPGSQLAEVAAHMRTLGGSALRCDRARADRRVLECRGSLPDPAHGGNVRVWLSAIDSTVGIMTLSGDVAPDQLDTWRDALEAEFGRVGARVQGPQWMMQWVRQGRMVRLTWRVNNDERVASVSLVDGRVLDGWRPARS